MALKNSQYYAIMREYEQRQLRNHDIQTARYQEVYKKLPEFKSLDESISILSVQYGKKLLNGDDHALDALKEELEILRSSKKNLLVSAGFPEDYLEPVYECPDCKDTGYIGNEKCHCFKKAVIRLLYDQSNIREFPSEAAFENFSLDFYSPSLYDKTTGRSARAMMEDIPEPLFLRQRGRGENLSFHMHCPGDHGQGILCPVLFSSTAFQLALPVKV